MAETGFDHKRLNDYFRGEHSDKDASYIHDVFCDNDKEEELKQFLLKQFYELWPEDEEDKMNLDHILYEIYYNINTRLPARKVSSLDKIIKWSVRLAGILILPLIIFAGVQTIKDYHSKKEAWVEIKAPAWTRAQFSLPDGTTGWLNSNSSIKYNGNFNTERQISLKGEAYFDVYKDKKRTFIVNTQEINVKVLGTKFNIASYENEKNVEVVLEEGQLIFYAKEMDRSFTMSPNDMIIFDKTVKNYSTEVVQPQKYISWTEGKLVFRNDPLDVIARRLERWYNIDVEVNVSYYEDIRLRATFVDENLEEVLNLLKRSLPVDYKIEYGNIQTNGIYKKTKVSLSLRNK